MGPESFKYWAFISYSHQDPKWGRWLHKALETYRIPKRLVGLLSRKKTVPKRLYPVFRDREELPSSANLSDNITQALRNSAYLIVICSPNSAASRWVAEEIRQFKAMRGEDYVLCLIVGGQPNATDKPKSGMLECFPEPIRYAVDRNGVITTQRTEPVAADVRPGKDRKGDAKLKLVAGVLGIAYDELKQRDKQRQRWLRSKIIAAAVVTLAFAASVIKWHQHNAAIEYNIEEGRKEMLAGRPLRALPLLSAAYMASPQDIILRYLLGQATAAIDAEVLVSDIAGGPTWFLAFSPSGNQVLLSGPHDKATVIDIDTKQILYQWKDHAGRVVFGAYSTNGEMIVTVGGNTASLREARDGSSLHTLAGHQLDVLTAAFNATGSLVVTGSVDNTARVWDTKNGVLALTLVGHTGSVIGAAFDSDGARILTTSTDASAKIWDSTTGKLLVTLDGHGGPVTQGVFSPDGKQVVTVSTDGTATLSNSTNGAMIRTIVGLLRSYRSSVAFTKAGSIIVVAPTEGYGAKLWDLSKGAELRSLVGHSAGVLFAATSRDGTRIVTTSQDKTAKVWNTATGTNLATFEEVDAFFGATATFSSDARRVAITDSEGVTKVVATDAGKRLSSFDGTNAVFSRDGSRITVLTSTAISIRCGDGRELVKTFIPPKAGMTYLSVNPDASHAVAADRQVMQVVDLATGQILLEDEGSRDPVTTAVLNDDATRLATISGIEAGGQKTLRIWDVANGGVLLREVKIKNSRNPTMPVSLSFAASGKVLVSATPQGIQLWDPGRGDLIRSFPPESGFMFDSISPKGNRIALRCAPTVAGNNAIEVWDVQTGSKLSHFEAPSIFVTNFDANGDRIAAGNGAHNTASVWDAKSGRLLVSFEGSHSPVISALFSPDGHRLVTGDLGGEGLRVWDAFTGKLLTVLNVPGSLSLRPFSPDGDRLLIAMDDNTTIGWNVRLESRSPADIRLLVEKHSPWRLQNGRLLQGVR